MTDIFADAVSATYRPERAAMIFAYREFRHQWARKAALAAFMWIAIAACYWSAKAFEFAPTYFLGWIMFVWSLVVIGVLYVFSRKNDQEIARLIRAGLTPNNSANIHRLPNFWRGSLFPSTNRRTKSEQ